MLDFFAGVMFGVMECDRRRREERLRQMMRERRRPSYYLSKPECDCEEGLKAEADRADRNVEEEEERLRRRKALERDFKRILPRPRRKEALSEKSRAIIREAIREYREKESESKGT